MTTDEQVAIITGAGSGIGRATARRLADRGVRTVLVGRSAARLESVAASLASESVVIEGDVADGAAIELAVRTATERFGRLDIVLANAGLYLGGDFLTAGYDEIAATVQANVTGVMTTVRGALPHLVAQGTGDVVVTSSVAGHIDVQWEPVYSPTKHAVQAFTHAVRQQLVGTGVRMGAIAPGVVLNELWGYQESETDRVAEKVADRTGITSDDVADAIEYMLTRPRHVTLRDVVILPTDQDI
ncbi:SDR family oxidoreductase [Microbacterium halotolerans]|uniref:SDR family oxidoreductase n=1 Tax=Microbacterium halotolerans TaxID=246613 RepID=UPI000E6AA005|nr:SDR family oxidoreductase [Microbacterium halotolerans]